jgi:hypothetical protein
MVRVCWNCSSEIPYQGAGRPRRYCDSTCKRSVVAERERVRAFEKAEAARREYLSGLLARLTPTP